MRKSKKVLLQQMIQQEKVARAAAEQRWAAMSDAEKEVQRVQNERFARKMQSSV